MYSIEYLFQECNLKKKVLHLELSQPVQLEDVLTNDIILLRVDSDEAKNIAFLKSIKDGLNTNFGVYDLIVSDKTGDPNNPKQIALNIGNIKEVWKI